MSDEEDYSSEDDIDYVPSGTIKNPKILLFVCLDLIGGTSLVIYSCFT